MRLRYAVNCIGDAFCIPDPEMLYGIIIVRPSELIWKIRESLTRFDAVFIRK